MELTAARRPGPQAWRLATMVQRLIRQKGANLESTAILSSNLASRSPEENTQNRKNLEHMLKQWGCGVKAVTGYGQEGKGRVVREPSFIVTNITLNQCKQVWNRFDQWGIIYIGEETSYKPMLLGAEKKPSGDYEDVIVELGEPEVVTPGMKKPENWTEIPSEKEPGYGIHLPVKGPSRMPGWKSPKKN